MGLNQVRVSFYVDVEATKKSEIDEAINNLLDQLGDLDTDLHWDNCDWDLIRVPEPLDKESN
jgi:hypothetical protein